jgi:hypothetical protein
MACAAAIVLAAPASASAITPAQSDDARYTLANGCYGLWSKSAGKFVAKTGSGYTASGANIDPAERIRMQATTLGEYLFYGKAADFMSAGSGDKAAVATAPSEAAEWKVEVVGDAYRITSIGSGKVLSVAPVTGELVLGGSGDAALFYFEPAEGCPQYPEADVNATGTPAQGPTSYNQVQGLVDAHLHMMAFEFIGGSIRCGRPWHKYGVPFAMVDCPDHGPGGVGAVAEGTLSYGNPVQTHDTVGWPTFKDWPAYRSLTHEQVYYKGLERAWRGGLRMFTNLMVDNQALCDVYPLKRNPCNEMNTVRLEIKDIRELEAYIDAQNGGPGKGWFRIVRSPWEARKVINQGKLAVILGMEVSKPFDCDVYNDQPQCNKKTITDWLDELESAGLSQMELVNKFDNALVGVAGDSGSTGLITSAGNKYETGNFFAYDRCKDDENSDRTPATQAPDHNTDTLLELYQMFAPSGALPVYGEGAQCNERGLTDLGEFVIRELIKRHIVFDPDHMSVLGHRQALAVTESASYSGVVSSHSWSTDDAYPRIYRAGGFNAPYAGSSESFVKEWRKVKKMRSKRFLFGFGYGADMNGFGGQGAPRGADAKTPVKYPFKSFDGSVSLDKARWGERVWDINTDGVAHYGIYPDWLEDLRMLAGDEIVKDMANGAEAYLQMWERADGIRDPGCRSVHEGFTSKQLGRVFLGHTPEKVLRSTNQPVSRPNRSFRWCVGDKGDRKGDMAAAFTSAGRVGLVGSTVKNHRFGGVGTGASSKRLKGKARSTGSGLYVRGIKGDARVIYGVKDGKVRFVALAASAVAKDRKELLLELKLAGLR